MTGIRGVLLTSALLAVSACQSTLPVPDYVSVKEPAPYRTGADGLKIDNEDHRMDPQGFRIDARGERVGEIDIVAKMGNEPSNAMAGFYVSSLGIHAPGRVMSASEGATAGAGYGPGSAGATVPSTEPGAPTPQPSAPTTTMPSAPATPPASGSPTPLTR
jgi:hypothetical protein